MLTRAVNGRCTRQGGEQDGQAVADVTVARVNPST
jgi:hypothetical protein